MNRNCGTATPGTDFTSLGTTVNFAAGESSAAVSVDALVDSTIEVDETVIVTIQTGTGYQRDLVYDATLVIVDATQTVTVYGYADAVEGGDSGTFTFVREGNLSQPLTVNFTVSGTATDGTDYDTLPTTVEFAADENTVDITIIPVDDMVTESTEEVELTLASGGYLLGSATSATINLFDKPVAAPPAAGTGNGLLANYYNTKTLDDVRTTKTDPQVNFRDATAWGRGAPTGTTGVGADQFSVRWTGQVKPLYSEIYTFQTFSDDGVRLWVDGVLLIDQWNDHSPTLHNTPVLLARNFTAGQQYDIKLEYYENTLDSTISLSWASPSQKRETIPQSQLFSHAAKVGDFVWLDTNRDGVQDAGEPGIRDVVVDVLDSNGNKVVASTKTGPDGKYEVTVPAGAQIKLKFTPGASSLIPTQQDSVAAGEYLDSDINADGETALFNAAGPGAAPDYYDAGFKGTATNPNSTNSGVLIELDVNNNGVLTDAVDGIANYLPGYEGTTAKLSRTVDQAMQVIVQGLAANTVYKISSVNTTKYDGIASNAMASFFANYNSSATDNDFALQSGNADVADGTDVSVTSDANGVAKIEIRARDFGGQTTIWVKNAAGTLLAERKLVLDSGDNDGIADKWEYEMVDRWTNQYGVAGLSLAASLNRFGPNGQDDEMLDPDGDRTQRLVEQAGTGDAHTVWEEYRGYFLDGGGLDGNGQNGHAGGHIRLDPARKEILLEVDRVAVLNNVPGNGTLEQKLKAILDGASKVFSNADRGAGIYLYYMFDEAAVAVPTEIQLDDGTALKNSRDTASARAAGIPNLATDFVHVLFVDKDLGYSAMTRDLKELDRRGRV